MHLLVFIISSAVSVQYVIGCGIVLSVGVSSETARLLYCILLCICFIFLF